MGVESPPHNGTRAALADPLFSVRGQTVVVSGASRGIGYAIAEGFTHRGAAVVVTGRDGATLEEAAATLNRTAPTTGGRAIPAVCDVTDLGAIHRLVEGVVDSHGAIDTLVNVAGVNRRKPALEITEDDYDFVVDANMKGAFFLSQAVGRHMVEHGGGNQINIGSLTTLRPGPQLLPYAVSKAGMGRMTEALAIEWGPHGVRVNCIAPGFILTDLTKELWAEKKMQDWGIPNTPLRRLGVPADLVGTAIFLASPAAAFLTGQTITVDGGILCGWRWPIEEL